MIESEAGLVSHSKYHLSGLYFVTNKAKVIPHEIMFTLFTY